VESKTEKKAIEQLVNSAHGRGMAVLGLEESLTALQMGAVHILYVQDGWHAPGVLCRNCGLFGIEKEICPGCGSKTTQVADMVDEVIETAIKTGSIIEHVHPDSGLEKHGRIGAVLRFKV
jgi:peptide subunit release factor 1 (eRF1)